MPPELEKALSAALKDPAKIWELRLELAGSDPETVVETCAAILQSYSRHKNFLLAVELTDYFILHDRSDYLKDLLQLQERAKATAESPSAMEKLKMNIELLEVLDNTDIDNLKCTCQVYSSHSAHPESCINIKIISKHNPSEGYVDMNITKARCTRCGKPWIITEEAYSSTGRSITWKFDSGDE